MTTSVVRWGILGCGDVTEVKSGPALQKTARSSVVAVMRRDGAKAKDYAARHNINKWCDSADTLIADENVNAIYVATPPSSHAELTVKALQSGKPVFVEKPMAMTTTECDAMIGAAKTADQSLIVAYYRRALPRFEKLRELIKNGAIGTPRVAQINQFLPGTPTSDDNWRTDLITGGGGLFVDMQSHTLDWLQYVFGEATKMRGLTTRQAGDYAAEDFVGFTGLFGDVAVAGTAAYSVAERREDVTIYGDTGSLCMSFFAHTPITLKTGGKSEDITIADPAHVHQPLVERIVAHLLDGAPNPCSGEEARRVNAVLSKLYEV